MIGFGQNGLHAAVCPLAITGYAPFAPSEGAFIQRKSWLWIVLAVSVGVYLNAFGHQFVYDDAQIIRDNVRIRSLGNLSELWTTNYWGEFGDRGLYRPLVLLTFALNYALTGLETWSYVAANIALHAAVSLLLVLLASALGAPAKVAGLTGLLFATHPVHTEAVGMLVGRADTMVAALFLAALVLHRQVRPTPGRARRRRVWVCGCLAAALLSKENAATFLPVVVTMDYLVPAREGDRPVALRARVTDYVAYAAVIGAILLLRLSVLGSWTVPTDTLSVVDNPIVPLRESTLGNFYGASTAEGRYTALGVLLEYLRLLVWPATLAVDYSYAQLPVLRSWADARVLGGAAVLAATLAAVFVLRSRVAIAAFGAAFLALTFSVTSNLAFPIGTICGERLLYLPSAGFCLGAVAAITRWLPRAGTWLLVALCVLGSVRTWARNPDLRDPRSFWTSAVTSSPNSAKARWGLGGQLGGEAFALQQQGRFDQANDLFERARSHLLRAIEIYPESGYAWNDLANIQQAQGRLQESLIAYERAAMLLPELSVTWANWGRALLAIAQRGDPGAGRLALQKLDRAIELAPNNPANYELRAHLHGAVLDDPQRARADRERARSLR